MKLIIEYAKNGEYLPDHLIDEWFDGLAATINIDWKHIDSTRHLTIASELMLMKTRLLVTRGHVDPSDIIYKYDGTDIKISKDGGLHTWPKGFCDNNDNILEELLTCRAGEKLQG